MAQRTLYQNQTYVVTKRLPPSDSQKHKVLTIYINLPVQERLGYSHVDTRLRIQPNPCVDGKAGLSRPFCKRRYGHSLIRQSHTGKSTSSGQTSLRQVMTNTCTLKYLRQDSTERYKHKWSRADQGIFGTLQYQQRENVKRKTYTAD